MVALRISKGWTMNAFGEGRVMWREDGHELNRGALVGPVTQGVYRRYQMKIGITGNAATGAPDIESLRMLGKSRWIVTD